MFSTDQRLAIEFELRTARRRAAQYLPFSPAWDAAVARVEALEREASRFGSLTAGLSQVGGVVTGWEPYGTSGQTVLDDTNSTTA